MKLSTQLLPPKILFESLNKINEKLPLGKHLPTQNTEKQLYVYYNIANTHAAMYKNKLRIIIQIPLITTDRYFSLYEAIQLPFKPKLSHSQFSFYINFETDFKFLAVNEDKSLYLPMTNSDLQSCTKNLLTICPPTRTVLHKAQDSCLYGLFVNNKHMIQTRCSIGTIINHPPYFYRSKNSDTWIYSVSSPTQVFYKCSDGTDTSQYPTLLNSTGLLNLSPNCYVISDLFRLLPHSNSYSLLNEQKVKYISPTFPVFQHLYNHTHFNLNITEPQYNKLQLELSNIGQTDLKPKGLDVNEYIKKVDNIHAEINSYTVPKLNKNTTHISLFFIIITIITTYFLYKYRQYLIACYKKIASSPTGMKVQEYPPGGQTKHVLPPIQEEEENKIEESKEQQVPSIAAKRNAKLKLKL
jgi:hypothetical protein